MENGDRLQELILTEFRDMKKNQTKLIAGMAEIKVEIQSFKERNSLCAKDKEEMLEKIGELENWKNKVHGINTTITAIVGIGGVIAAFIAVL